MDPKPVVLALFTSIMTGCSMHNLNQMAASLEQKAQTIREERKADLEQKVNGEMQFAEVELKNKAYSTKELRQEIISQINRQHDNEIYVFGNYVDGIQNRLEKMLTTAQKGTTHVRTIETVPGHFFDRNPEWRMEVYQDKIPTMKVIQKYKGKDIVLLDTKVAPGKVVMQNGKRARGRWSSVPGQYYLTRFHNYPRWFPPDWAKEKYPQPPKPGKNNPYGLWMAELGRVNEISGYQWAVPGDSMMRLHSTNDRDSIGTYDSHSCIRTHPAVADELFLAIKHYFTNGIYKEKARGMTYLFKRSIPFKINPLSR